MEIKRNEIQYRKLQVAPAFPFCEDFTLRRGRKVYLKGVELILNSRNDGITSPSLEFSKSENLYKVLRVPRATNKFSNKNT